MLSYRKATPEDARALSLTLREADRAEILLSSGADVEGALVRSVAVSEVCIAAVDETGVLCLWGIARYPDAPGASIWMLGSPGMYRYRKRLIAEARPWVQAMLPHYGLLGNYVSIDNKRSIQWLHALGFQFMEAVPFGVSGALFYPFYMRDNNV